MSTQLKEAYSPPKELLFNRLKTSTDYILETYFNGSCVIRTFPTLTPFKVTKDTVTFIPVTGFESPLVIAVRNDLINKLEIFCPTPKQAIINHPDKFCPPECQPANQSTGINLITILPKLFVYQSQELSLNSGILAHPRTVEYDLHMDRFGSIFYDLVCIGFERECKDYLTRSTFHSPAIEFSRTPSLYIS